MVIGHACRAGSTIPDRGGFASIRDSIRRINGVIEIVPHEPREQGPNLLTFEVHMERDVREAVISFSCWTWIGVLQLSRSHRDLENVFLQLSESDNAMTANAVQNESPEEVTQ